MIIHKWTSRLIPGERLKEGGHVWFRVALCGAKVPTSTGQLRVEWRYVTCKRCLRMKDKHYY